MLLPVRNTRSGISKEAMIHNSAQPQIEVDPDSGEVRADGELLSALPQQRR
jgi:urease subunit alpha